jgi:ubiquinone/menaquinone biosynthesis C-methylase UbiE
LNSVDELNVAFWNELCGTTSARKLGIVDDSPASLKKFDDWFFEFYPYLFDHIPFESLAGREVLEIGLGYGTVAQRLMQSHAEYHGLDVADGPLAMARHRALLLGKQTTISQGSALAIPYADGSFDHVVTIGCLHHTGDLAQAFREVHRVLRSGGAATIMVYNALSYRHWMHTPVATYRRLKEPVFEWSNASSGMRQVYDANEIGRAAPSTVFISAQEAHAFLSKLFSSVRVTRRNIAAMVGRAQACAWFERSVGLDLYIECIK